MLARSNALFSGLATIDLFQFNDGGHDYFPDLCTEDLFGSHPRLGQDPGPALLIIEDVDLEAIYRLRTYVGPDKSFTRFLDRFLCDLPSYVFDDDITVHFPALQSTKKQRHHLGFHYHHAREFQSNFKVRVDNIPKALAEGSAYWRREATYGTMNPCQRLNSTRTIKSEFPPVLICRQHCAAWFDVDVNGQWKTGKHLPLVSFLSLLTRVCAGVILVEPNFKTTANMAAALSRPLYTNLLDRTVIQDPTQETPYRTVLSMLTKHALGRDGPALRPPPPYRLLEGIYRILTAEWMVLHTYYLRDINSIVWRLHRGRADTFTSTRQFEDVLDLLFRMRLRLAWAIGMVDDQRTICAARGSALSISWNGYRSTIPEAADDVWTDLVADYDQVLGLLRRDDDRAQENISYIASLLTIQQTGAGVREAERTTEQNRMVLVLAIIATFLLPIGTASTVLSMEGDWGPGGPNFGVFWAVVLPASVVLMGSMLSFMYWGRQNRQATPVPVKTVTASQSLADGDNLGGHGTGWNMHWKNPKWVYRRRPIVAGNALSGEGV